jgi:hypothetical protein
MNQDFIRLKQLHGELVLSQKKSSLGTSITTKEIFFQKPHHTYHILFENILSIIPYQLKRNQTTIKIGDELHVHSTFSEHFYKITVSEMVIHNRNGKFVRKEAEIIIPLSKGFLEKVNQYSDLTFLPAL